MSSQFCDAMCARYPHQHHVQHIFHLINNTSHQIGPLKCQRRDPFVLQVSKEQPRTVTTPQETIYCKKCLFPCEAAPHWVVFNHVTGGGSLSVTDDEEDPRLPMLHVVNVCLSLREPHLASFSRTEADSYLLHEHTYVS